MKAGKIWIIVGVAVGACCVGAVVGLFVILRGVAHGLTSDPDEAARIGHQIVEYAAPAGYHEVMAMDLFGAKVVALQPAAPAAEGVVLSLMELPAGVAETPAQAERRMRAMWARRAEHRLRDARVVGAQDVVIRGRPVKFALAEGRTERGAVARQLYGVFPGSNGATVTFMALGQADAWNQDVVNRFLASIR